MAQAISIRLTNLDHSLENARTREAKADPELKASIIAHGLIQNLIVCKNAIPGFADYEVIAGGRRLTAMKELQKEKKLPDDYEVQCLLIPVVNAKELSLAENVMRKAMHPADEAEAFAYLIAKGSTTEEIAKRFSLTERRVQQSLRLGTIHPTVLKAYREEKCDLREMQAFALTDDQAKQLRVFKSLKGHALNSSSISEAILDKAIRATDKIACFVTLDAYKAAGGEVREDLFGDAIYLTNSTLLWKLANEKLETRAAALRKEGWKWVEIVLENEWSYTMNMRTIKAEKKEDKAKAGVVITIAREGKLEIKRGLMKKADEKAAAKPKSGKPAEKPISDRLKTDLASYRREVARAAISDSSHIAFDIVVFKACSQFFEGAHHYGGASITFKERFPMPGVDDENSNAKKRIELIKSKLNSSWTKEKSEVEQFIALSKLTLEEKMDLLAFATGATIDSDLAIDVGDDDFIEAALAMTNDEVSMQWRPTAVNYFSRIGKVKMLEIAEKLFGKNFAMDHKNDKSGALAVLMEKAFQKPGDYLISPASIAAVMLWLPEGMDFEMPVVKAPKKKRAA